MMSNDYTPALVCELCGQYYAIAIDDVVEVAVMVEAVHMNTEAGASPMVYGVVIRRGAPLVLLDLRLVFHCDVAPVDLDTLFVVARRSDGELVGFLVDHVEGVIYFPIDDVRPMQGGGEFVRGVVAYNGRLIQWLDVPALTADIFPAEM